jgi:single-strand DNA-binding protein
MATRSMNIVILMGNLTRDPEIRYTASGTPVCTFTIATNRNYLDSSGNKVESAEFTNVVAWAKLAEICSKILKKGTKAIIEGRLQTSKWNDKNTGQEVRRTEVVAEQMHLVSNPAGGAQAGDQSDVETYGSDTGAGDAVDFSDFIPVDNPSGGNNGGSGTPF